MTSRVAGDGYLTGPFASPPKLTYGGKGGDSVTGWQIVYEAEKGTKAFRQGVLNLQLNRAAGEADTTWDGNPDCILKLIATNRATGNASGEGAIRAIDAQARNRGTNINWVNAANLNARNDSGMIATSLWGLLIRCENYGTINTDIVGIDVNLSDENDTGTHTKHGILIRNTDQSAQTAADAAIKVSHTSTNGFSHFAELATNDGDGCVGNVVTPSTTTVEALIIKVGANTRYIPIYAALAMS